MVMYLPVFIGEGSKKMNLGAVYRDLEDCLKFVFSLGYDSRVEDDSRMLYEGIDDGYVEIAMVELR